MKRGISRCCPGSLTGGRSDADLQILASTRELSSRSEKKSRLTAKRVFPAIFRYARLNPSLVPGQFISTLIRRSLPNCPPPISSAVLSTTSHTTHEYGASNNDTTDLVRHFLTPTFHPLLPPNLLRSPPHIPRGTNLPQHPNNALPPPQNNSQIPIQPQ